MAILQDAIEEFKGASPGGKALMLVAVIAIAGLGIYVYKQKQASNGNSGNNGTLVPIDNSGGGTNTTGTSSSPTPVTGTTGITGVTGNPPVARPILNSLATVITGGWLATTPGGTNNKGVNITNLSRGSKVTILNQLPFTFNGNKYYQVRTSNGLLGYVNAHTIGR